MQCKKNVGAFSVIHKCSFFQRSYEIIRKVPCPESQQCGTSHYIKHFGTVRRDETNWQQIWWSNCFYTWKYIAFQLCENETSHAKQRTINSVCSISVCGDTFTGQTYWTMWALLKNTHITFVSVFRTNSIIIINLNNTKILTRIVNTNKSMLMVSACIPPNLRIHISKLLCQDFLNNNSTSEKIQLITDSEYRSPIRNCLWNYTYCQMEFIFSLFINFWHIQTWEQIIDVHSVLYTITDYNILEHLLV